MTKAEMELRIEVLTNAIYQLEGNTRDWWLLDALAEAGVEPEATQAREEAAADRKELDNYQKEHKREEIAKAKKLLLEKGFTGDD